MIEFLICPIFFGDTLICQDFLPGHYNFFKLYEFACLIQSSTFRDFLFKSCDFSVQSF